MNQADLPNKNDDLEQRRFEADILYKEYKNRFDEMLFHSNRYHRQVDYIQLYITLLVSVLSFFFISPNLVTFVSNLGVSLQGLYITVICLAFVIALYLFSNIMDSLYMMYANGIRLANIEKEINGIAGKELMRWDSQIVPKLFASKQFTVGAWARPSILVGLWSFLFFLLVTVGLCTVSFFMTGNFFYVFTWVALLLTSFSLANWVLLHTDGISYIDYCVAGLTAKKFKASSLSTYFLVYFANFFLAYLPMVLISIKQGAFGFGNYEFPFMSIPSVWLGDLIILPIFDMLAIKWFEDAGKIDKKRATVSLIISMIINAYLNYSWINDPWTGFMDTKLGVLGPAGWIHAVYSFIQIALVTYFAFYVFDYLYSKKVKTENASDNSHIVIRTISWLTAFSFLSIPDWAVRNFYVFKDTFFNAIYRDWVSFLPFVISILFLLAIVLRTRSSYRKPRTKER